MTDASLQPHWLPEVQNWAVDQERMRHQDALYAYGEFAMFVLMWRIQDFEAGLVRRCPTCYVSEGEIAEAYGQGNRRNCPDCFGSTFEGGYRAKIIRLSIWDHDSTEQHPGQRGDTFQANARVQSTDDFNLNTDDYVFRRDGTRWQIRKTDWDLLRTGFRWPSIGDTLLGWNLTSVDLEDLSSVAYLIPPSNENLCRILSVHRDLRYPPDYSTFEDIRGPLLPSDECTPAVGDTDDSGGTTDVGGRTALHIRSTMSAAGATDVGQGVALLRRQGSVSAGATDAIQIVTTSVRQGADVSGAADVVGATVIPGTPQVEWVITGLQFTTSGPVITSLDGTALVDAATPHDGVPGAEVGYCVARSDTRWMVGTSNGIITSIDGVAWTNVTSPFDGDPLGSGRTCRGLACYRYGPGSTQVRWVAVGVDNDANGGNGAPLSAMSNDDGATWSVVTVFAGDNGSSSPGGHCVAFNGSLWVAGGRGWDGTHTQQIMTSPDGINWTRRPTPADGTFDGDGAAVGGLAWNGSLFVAVASTAPFPTAMTSPDGITWTARSTPWDSNGVNGGGTGVAWGGGLWVAAGGVLSAGVFIDQIITSPDAINWTARTTPFDNPNGPAYSVAWSGTEWMAGGSGNSPSRLATSPDGITWTAVPDSSEFLIIYLATGIAFNPSTLVS